MEQVGRKKIKDIEEQLYQPTRPNRHVLHTPPYNNRIHIFHVHTEHLLRVYS